MKTFFIGLAIAAYLTLASIMGCKGSHLSDSSSLNHIGNGLARIGGDVDSAQGSITVAKPHADDVGQAHLDDASSDLTDAKTQLATTQKNYEIALSDAALQAHNAQTLADELKAERAHWVGYRTRLLARWVIGIALSVWLLVGIAFAITSISPIAWLSPIVLEIERFLPAMNPWEWLVSYLKAKQVVPIAPVPAT